MIPGITASQFFTAPTPPGPGGDPYWADVWSLLHFEDAAGNGVTITDETGRSWTRNANGTTSTTQEKFGVSSWVYDGTTANGLIHTTADNFGVFKDIDFTVEMWIYLDPAATSGNRGLWFIGDINNNLNRYQLAVENSKLVFYCNDSSSNFAIATSTSSISSGVWTHVALTQDSATARIFIDGVLEGSTSTAGVSTNITTSHLNWVGASRSAGAAQPFYGYIDDFRQTMGVARYTATFTPPTDAFPDGGIPDPDPYWSDVFSLIHFDGSNLGTTFTDEKAITWTAGSANIYTATAQKKFGTASLNLPELSTDDFLYTQAVALPGSFTVECWIYLNSTANRQGIWCAGDIDVSNNRHQLAIESGKLVYYKEYGGMGASAISSSTLSTGQWYHVRLCVDYQSPSNNSYIFIDGVLEGTTSSTVQPQITSSHNFYIGVTRSASTRQNFDGYIDDFRLTNGVARSTATFTPPTDAFPDS